MAYQRPRLDRDTAQAQAAGAPSLQAGTLDVHPHRQACRGPGRDRLARTAPQRQPDRLAHPRPRQQDPQDRPRRRLQRLTRPDPAEPCSERRPALSVSTSENDQNPGPVAMLVGIVVSVWLFSNQTEYVGVVPKHVPAVGDITFVAGFALSAVLYLLLRRADRRLRLG